MNNKLSLTFILTPLLLAIWLTNCVLDALAEWELIPDTRHMFALTLESDGQRLYAGASDGVYISDDDGDSWRLTGLHNAVQAIAVSGHNVYAAPDYDPGGMYRSDDYGETWKRINTGLPKSARDDGTPFLPYTREILVTHSGAVIAVGYHHGTYISHDRGDTWQSVEKDWVWHGESAWFFGNQIWSMTEFDSYWWAVYSGGHLFHSDDNGASWELLGGGLAYYGDVADWAVRDGQLYVAGEYRVGRWNEGALGWDNLGPGLPPPTYEETFWPQYRQHSRKTYPVLSLAVDRGRLFAGIRRQGVYLYDERSESWKFSGLPEFAVRSLVSHGGYLYAAAGRTAYGLEDPDRLEGIYRASIPIVQPYNKAAVTWGAIKRP